MDVVVPCLFLFPRPIPGIAPLVQDAGLELIQQNSLGACLGFSKVQLAKKTDIRLVLQFL